MKNNISQVSIIGAGPIGMYAAYYCSLRGLKVHLFDSMPILGGQLSNIYPEKNIYDLPGYSSIEAKEFINNLQDQLKTQKQNIKIYLSTKVENIQQLSGEYGDVFEVKTNNNFSLNTKSIIICTGKGAFSPIKLGIKDENLIENITYFVKEKKYFENKKIVIFGGGDSAVDTALMLKDIAEDISIIHRRDSFRAISSSVDKLKKSNIRIFKPYLLENFTVKENNIEKIIIKNRETNKDIILENIDNIIVNYGNIMSIDFIKNIPNIEMKNMLINVNSKFETNIRGIFACGDSCFYSGREIQIATGLGEVVNATASVYRYLFPTAGKITLR